MGEGIYCVIGSHLGKRNRRGLEMNGEHYVFYDSQLSWTRSCSIRATVTPIALL